MGIERGTRGIRPPEISVIEPMRTHCRDDQWSVAAIECFATMIEDDLGACAGQLTADAREHVFTALGGVGDDRTAIAVAQARLVNLAVGIAECDRFVGTVARVLGCEQMALETRAQLGNETAEFWSLPTARLGADARQRMADVCGKSLASLQQHAADAGCMP